MPMSVASQRKGKHLGQPSPLNEGLIKHGQKYAGQSDKQITGAQNPAGSEKYSGSPIKPVVSTKYKV